MTTENQTHTPAAAELSGVGIRVGGALIAWFNAAAEPGDWATENYFGQWLAHSCSMPDRAVLVNDSSDVADDELLGIGIRVKGQLLAWFAYAKDGHDWAKENYPGQWQAHPCYLPNRPPFTPEQIAAAKAQAEKLYDILEAGSQKVRSLEE